MEKPPRPDVWKALYMNDPKDTKSDRVDALAWAFAYRQKGWRARFPSLPSLAHSYNYEEVQV